MGKTYRSKKFRRSKNEFAVQKNIYWLYNNGAKRRNIKFDIELGEFILLINMDCEICGSPPMNKRIYKSYKPLLYNGIDRINNDLGYVSGNIRPCCFKCNRMKSKLTDREFKNHVIRIAQKIAERKSNRKT